MSSGGQTGSDDSVTVVPEDVRAVGRYVYEMAETLRTALESAATDVEGLLNGGWSGTSATNFSEGWGDVRDGGSQIMSALTGMAEKLGVTADTYEATDEGTSSQIVDSSLRL
ncbi:WXG100 family type VII secretion target [Nocardia rhamnosiphila]|uniref:WXG100 family type VII secretion target n=1 Tax=Nocardia rhamnosiphila TaxID=426716 RepID=UPI0033D93C82